MEEEDKAIEATASLLFHLNQEIETTVQPDAIHFEEQEITSLWTKALPLDPAIASICEEYQQYCLYGEKEILNSCADQLRAIWISSNAFIGNTEERKNPFYETKLYGIRNLAGHPLLTSKIQKEIAPYILPSFAPVAPILDQIFGSSRPTFNSTTLTQAGFTILHKQPRSHIIVASHPALPGFLLKLYYDTELRLKYNEPGWKWFARRCSGAQLIRQVIAKKGIKHFTVPVKFIYVLPANTVPPRTPEVDPKLAVLIVEDMHLVNDDLNYAAWKQIITPEILNELYIIISRANGSSYRPDNIPLTQSGQFAFIDTEYPYHDPDFQSIRPYLSTQMRAYWDELVKQGGRN